MSDTHGIQRFMHNKLSYLTIININLLNIVSCTKNVIICCPKIFDRHDREKSLKERREYG